MLEDARQRLARLEQPAEEAAAGVANVDLLRAKLAEAEAERDELPTSTQSKPTLAKPTLAIVIRPTLAKPTLAKVKVLVVCKDFGFGEFFVWVFLKLIVQVFLCVELSRVVCWVWAWWWVKGWELQWCGPEGWCPKGDPKPKKWEFERWEGSKGGGSKGGCSKGGCSKGGGSKGGGSKGPWGGGPNPEKMGSRRVGGPKFRAFFPLPPQNSFFSPSLVGLFVGFWCLKRRGAQMCTFGVLGVVV